MLTGAFQMVCTRHRSLAVSRLQDKRLTFDEWRANGDLKAAVPFGQLPVLEVDGKYIAQSAAIGEQWDVTGSSWTACTTTTAVKLSWAG
jgi:hypothetical protein